MDKANLIQLRPYQLSDKAFVFKTFLEGLRNGNETFKKTHVYEFHKNYQKVIERLLSIPETKTTIACLKEDFDVILAYSITRPNIIDWCFTKPAWRGLGIAKDLVAHISPKAVSHITKAGDAIRMKYNLIYDPFK